MPPDRMIWDGTSDDIDDWIDRVLNKRSSESYVRIDPSEIE